MGFDAYVKIDGIDGESTDGKRPGWIEVITCETKLNQIVSSTASSAGGATAGLANFNDFVFSKLVDKSTPKLALACADGTHIDTIVINFYRAGGEKLKFMEYELGNCIISAMDTAAGPGEFPVDTIAVNYGKIQWCYTVQSRAGGGAAGHVASGWNIQKNCKI